MWKQSDYDTLSEQERTNIAFTVLDGVYCMPSIHAQEKVRRFQKIKRLFDKDWIVDDYLVGQWADIHEWVRYHGAREDRLRLPKSFKSAIPNEYKLNLRNFRG